MGVLLLATQFTGCEPQNADLIVQQLDSAVGEGWTLKLPIEQGRKRTCRFWILKQSAAKVDEK